LFGGAVPQVKKAEVEKRLLNSARDEFLSHGFQAASLRNIAKAANVSLANVYSYAKDKDDLFRRVLMPVVSDIDRVEKYFSAYTPAGNDFDSLDKETEQLRSGVSYIYAHRAEFALLLNQSSGSTLENYPEKIVRGYAENCGRFLDHVKKSNPQVHFVGPSNFFFESVARFALKTISEMLRQKFSKKAMESVATEIAAYNFHGFRGMAQVTRKQLRK
jgi:AcrR family transcriptional regulator